MLRSIIRVPTRGLKVAQRREIKWEFENERKAFKQAVSQKRLKHKADYWDN
jgi:hypothetical protein